MAQILKHGSQGNEVRMLQKGLNMELKLSLVVDGDYGNGTVNAVKALQTRSKLPLTGEYGLEEQKVIGPFIASKFLSFETVEAAASQYGLPASVLKAIADVEARGCGFLNDGRPLILFERHKFYEHLSKAKGEAAAKAAMASNPNICHPQWDKSAYRGKEGEYPRLQQAMQFDKTAALKSASWGMFQIMGDNHKACGFSTVDAFVESVKLNETEHFKGLINFIRDPGNKRILDAIKAKDFVSLARYYNGPGYAANQYDVKLRNASALY